MWNPDESKIEEIVSFLKESQTEKGIFEVKYYINLILI
jgi:hypothetical protein